MQLEPSSIACTTLVLPIVMISLKKPFAPFSTDPNWKQTQSQLDSPHFSQVLHVSDLLFLTLRVLIVSVKAYLHGTTLSHATSLRQAYDTNCIV